MPKPPKTESTYFNKKNFQKRKKIAEEKREISEKEERKKLKELHWHRCPECGLEMEEMSFKGSSILRCKNCGGAFLQHEVIGELCGEESSIVDSVIELFKFR